MTEPKKPTKPSDTPDAIQPTKIEPPDGEMDDDDLDAVSGGLRATDPVVVTKPPVCLTQL